MVYLIAPSVIFKFHVIVRGGGGYCHQLGSKSYYMGATSKFLIENHSARLGNRTPHAAVGLVTTRPTRSAYYVVQKEHLFSYSVDSSITQTISQIIIKQFTCEYANLVTGPLSIV